MNTPPTAGAVVVGYDGSENSLHALATGVELARLEHRPVHLLLSYRPNPWPATVPGQVIAIDELLEVVRADAATTLSAGVDEARQLAPELQITSELTTTNPREALAAAAPGAAAVVVGARGGAALRGLLLGSVSRWISQHAECPVWVARPPHSSHAHPIVVGTDGTATSSQAVDFAFAQASFRRLPLRVVFCPQTFLPDIEGYRPRDASVIRANPEVAAMLAEVVAGLGEKYPDVEASMLTPGGPARSELAHLSQQASLLVLGSHRRHGVSAAMRGSVSRDVVEHATCTVVVVPG